MNKRFVLILITVLHICVFALGIIIIYSDMDVSDDSKYAQVSEYPETEPLETETLGTKASDMEASNIETSEIEISDIEAWGTEEEGMDPLELAALEIAALGETEAFETEISEIEASEIETSEIESLETEFLCQFTYRPRSGKKLNIRKGPSTNYEIIGKIPANGVGNVIEFVDDNWAFIEYDGIQGYCSRDWMETE